MRLRLESLACLPNWDSSLDASALAFLRDSVKQASGEPRRELYNARYVRKQEKMCFIFNYCGTGVVLFGGAFDENGLQSAQLQRRARRQSGSPLFAAGGDELS